MPENAFAGLRRLALFLIYIAAISAYPVAASAQEHHAEAAGSGETVRHLHFHEETIPELASVVDGVRAALAKTQAAGDGATLAPAEKEGELILTDEKADFLAAGVGEKGQLTGERAEENMLYAVFVKADGKDEKFVVTEVKQHELVLEAEAGGKKEAGEKAEPVTVSYKVKEIGTPKSNVIGEGITGLNWSDVNNIVFSMLTIFLLITISFLATRNMKKVPPKGLQNIVELLVGGLKGFVEGILGEHTVAYMPLVGTLFIYILFMALMGLIPFAKSPIALNYNIPLSMALCVFIFVQYHAIKQNGVGGYVKHLMGEPVWLAPLQMPLHILGEFIKPFSLSMRLFANVSAEDILVAALVLMMIGLPAYIPVPLQVLFFPLALMFSLIQALVFMSLSAVYISLMFPHHEHHDEGHH